jgi:hypothetical protein
LVFSDAFLEHDHCIDMASGALLQYVLETGKYPAHTNGYGDALALLSGNYVNGFGPLNGPGFDDEAIMRFIRSGKDVPEELCGRIYIQGFTTNNDAGIAILFDKLSSPGDHVHGFKRMSSPYRRDVVFLGGGDDNVLDKDWAAFVRQQVELLVKAGFTRRDAYRLYAETFSARYP